MPPSRRRLLTSGSVEPLSVGLAWECVDCVAALELRRASPFVEPISWSLYGSGSEQVSLKPGRYPLAVRVLGSPGGSFSLRVGEESPAGMEPVSVVLGRAGSKTVRRALRVDPSLVLAATPEDGERYIGGAHAARSEPDHQIAFAPARSEGPLRSRAAAFVTKRVFFGTDRRPTGSTNPGRYFGEERAEELAYGVCDVSIPAKHRIAKLERPLLFFPENPRRHVVLFNVETWPRETFIASLLRSATDLVLGSYAALIFVHGYNVSFAEAARRTAQIAYDLQFEGAAILYSWPSRDRILDYIADGTSIRNSERYISEFLVNVSAALASYRVHIIAHSMCAEPG